MNELIFGWCAGIWTAIGASEIFDWWMDRRERQQAPPTTPRHGSVSVYKSDLTLIGCPSDGRACSVSIDWTASPANVTCLTHDRTIT